MIELRNRFIQDVDLNEDTSLTHLLDRHDTEDDENVETQIIKHSPFYGQAKFADLIRKSAGLSILDLNIQNIFSKFDELVCFIQTINIKHPISAICLNECWISQEHDVTGLHLEGYTMFFQRGNRVGHGHCGLITYIHESFLSKEIAIENVHTSWDYLCVQLSHTSPNSRKYLLCNVYRLPCYLSEDIHLFTIEFSNFLRSVKHINSSVFICGDFNINLLLISSNRHFADYFDNVISTGFFPKITLPTRIQENSSTLIDQIWSNNLEENIKSKSGIIINDISDHKMIFTFIENTAYVEKHEKYIKVEHKNQSSVKNFVDELESMKIYDKLNQNINESPEDNYNRFAHLVNSAREKHLSTKIVKYNKRKHKKSCWMTYGILESINNKNKLYKRFIQTDKNNIEHFNTLKNEYHIYRARLRRTIREAKRMFYTRTFLMYKNDMKKTWGVISDTLKSSDKSKSQVEFIVGNHIVRDTDEIANHFNDYFINISRTLLQQIQPTHSFDHYLNENAASRLQFHPVNKEYISKLIDKLKNKASYGHDNISNKLIKSAKEVLVEPLTLLVNQMLKSGHFPSELKISRVKPLFKNGDPAMFSNYRPISLLPSMSKIFEYVIFYQLFDYMCTNNLLTIEQFGFRTGHSTELAAIQLIDHLTKQMDMGKVPTNIYIDLSKAFDTLDHSILLDKLTYYGVCGLENLLLRDYLSGRHQYVDYNGSKSRTNSISLGVPQGSILGPLLFLIYINDLPKVSHVFSMLMYADDTTLYCNLDDSTSDILLNNELTKITDWLSSNKLSLNVKKTKFMVFHTPQRRVNYPTLKLNNVNIERVSQFNFLGVILASSLKWDKHVAHVSLKISRVIGVLYRLKHIFPREVLLTLYNALILPHLSYCILVWGSKIDSNHKLLLLQKKAVRIITNQDYIAHSEPLCKLLNVLKVSDLFVCSLWKFYYKLTKRELPPYFDIMLPTLPNVCDYYNIRSPIFHLPFIKHGFAEQRLDYQLIKILNVHGSMLFARKVQHLFFYAFKTFVKYEILNNYVDRCYEANCVTCHIVAQR